MVGLAWREPCAQTITQLGNCCMNNLQSFDHKFFQHDSFIQLSNHHACRLRGQKQQIKIKALCPTRITPGPHITFKKCIIIIT